MTTATHKLSPDEPKRAARQQCGVGVTRRRNPTIFLDMDGVLAWCLYGVTAAKRLRRDCVEQLERIVQATGARVVISSTWRLGFGPEWFEEQLRPFGFTGQIIAVTPSLPSEHRGAEIQAWIDAQPVDTRPRKLVILEDAEDLGALEPRCVRTDYDRGLTEADASRAIRMLGRTRLRVNKAAAGPEGWS